jgi:CubicO group peptidase (beta-lactamase class C family)
MRQRSTRLAFVFILFIILPSSLRAQTLEARLKEIDEYASKAGQDWKVPGFALAIVKDDRVVFAKGYGVRELGKPETVDADTLFAIASNTKAFTAAALATLVDEGKLNWDDPVTKYLPSFQLSDPFVTRELKTH